MEGVHVAGAEPEGLEDGSPPVGSRGKVPIGVWGASPPEGEAKCEISVQFITFSCIKFRI